MAPQVGERWRFRPSGSDLGPRALAAAGQEVEVKAVIDTTDEYHDLEVLPMYRIVFASGDDLEVWEDELEAIDGPHS